MPSLALVPSTTSLFHWIPTLRNEGDSSMSHSRRRNRRSRQSAWVPARFSVFLPLAFSHPRLRRGHCGRQASFPWRPHHKPYFCSWTSIRFHGVRSSWVLLPIRWGHHIVCSFLTLQFVAFFPRTRTQAVFVISALWLSKPPSKYFSLQFRSIA